MDGLRACCLYYALLVLNSMYNVLSVAFSLFFLQGIPLHQIMIHADIARIALLLVFWYYMIRIKYPDEYARFVQMTRTGNISGGMMQTYNYCFSLALDFFVVPI